ncbi:MAG TPA: hypothetical protein VIJ66_12135 [Solirubrobacteraceae bacterium]
MIALVFAATGGAFAATGGGSGPNAPGLTASAAKHKAKKPKAKPGPRGPAGPAGKQGVQGLAGPAGPAGAQGAPGAKGETGAKGDPGAGGSEGAEGPEGQTGPQGPKGDTGGQGPQGNPGQPGQPWTPNNVLPSGATETGTWGGQPEENKKEYSSINFTIPLAQEVEQAKVHLVPQEPEATGTGNLESGSVDVKAINATSGEFKVGAGIKDTTNPAAIPPGTTILNVVSPSEIEMTATATATATGDTLKAGNPPGCPEGASAKKPEAEKGNLCIYIGENLLGGVSVEGPYTPYGLIASGAGTAGALLDIEGKPGKPHYIAGSWAVTGE